MTALVGLFGGTFDPIHQGHLQILKQLLTSLPFDNIQIIPCGQPPHRTTPGANAQHRLEMVKLATQELPHCETNDGEIHRTGPSYSIDTIKAFRLLMPDQSLCFILSTDAFNQFNQWHQWKIILDYCHVVIIRRKGYGLTHASWMEILFKKHLTSSISKIATSRSGYILLHSLHSSPISATFIRKKLFEKDYTAVRECLPPRVLAYIKKNKLYQSE